MPDRSEAVEKITEMALLVLKMWRQSFAAFMEHDLEILTGVLDDERKLNQMEKDITSALVELARSTKDKDERLAVMKLADVVADLEMIGDYCKDILERVQIKIEEKLLFSEDAVKEYTELYRQTERAIAEIVEALENQDAGLVKKVLTDARHIDSLVDDYRQRHNQRLVKGVCAPFACNMYINMLDFTAASYYHAKKIARSLLKVKL